MVYDGRAMNESGLENIRTGRLSRVLSIGLASVIVILCGIGLVISVKDFPSWAHSRWTIAIVVLDFVSYTIAAASFGGLIGLLCGSWLSRRFIIIFWTSVGQFAPAVGLMLAMIVDPEIPVAVEQIVPFFAAAGVAGLIYGIVAARGRTGLTRRSRRFAIVGAVLGAALGFAGLLLARFSRPMLHYSPFNVPDMTTPGTIVVICIVSALLCAVIGAAIGADRRNWIGFPVEVADVGPDHSC